MLNIRPLIKQLVSFMNIDNTKIEHGSFIFYGSEVAKALSILLPQTTDLIKIKIQWIRAELFCVEMTKSGALGAYSQTTQITLTFSESIYLNYHAKKLFNMHRWMEKNKDIIASNELFRSKLKFLNDQQFSNKANELLDGEDEND